MMGTRPLLVLAALSLAGALPGAAAEGRALIIDFSKRDHGFTPNRFIEDARLTDEGLAFRSNGRDPFLTSGALPDLPNDVRLRVALRMKTTAPGGAQLFHTSGHSEQDSHRFLTWTDGKWHTYRFFIPPQPKGSRLRLDPALGEGAITIASLALEPMPPLRPVVLPKPGPYEPTRPSAGIETGDLRVVQDGNHWCRFAVEIGGKRMALSHSSEVIQMADGTVESLADADCRIFAVGDTITVQSRSSGGRFDLERTIHKVAIDGILSVVTTITARRKCEIAYLPIANLFPGLGSFETKKSQALLPGVEYLADEPSSNESDLKGEAAQRRLVDDVKLTQPLMAFVHDGRALGLYWDRSDHPAAVFDTPDRMFRSGAQVMGLWLPGVGDSRRENAVTPDAPVVLDAGERIRFRFHLVGVRGETVVPVLQKFIEARPLPEVPEFAGGFEAAVRLLGAGWVDSAAHRDGTWRHAVWQDRFGFQPSADACAFTKWLATHLRGDALGARLDAASRRGREQLHEGDAFLSEISHIRRRPAAPLVFGDLSEAVAALKRRAQRTLTRFDESGIVRYRPRPGGEDYGATHFEDHANGMTSLALVDVLNAAAFTGNPDLIARGLSRLDQATTHYAKRVPRGAQTWEVPLHTPDILASAQLVQAYTLGYLLSGKRAHLDEARYWAWTGVPFVYLDPPAEGPVGTYATIAVFGATNRVAPIWIGLPVQWCGLVYRSALEELARAESDPAQATFWRKLARGITVTGLQHTFPPDDGERRGLLPDFFALERQDRAGPAINPGTVQAHLGEAFDKTPFFTRTRLAGTDWIAHVPGNIGESRRLADGTLEVFAEGWPADNHPYFIHIARIAEQPTLITWNGGPPLDIVHRPDASLTVKVRGTGKLSLK